MSRFFEVLTNVWKILFNSNLSMSRRVVLLSEYLRIVAKRFVRRFNFSWVDYTSHNFLGTNVVFDDFEDFYWTFLEVTRLSSYILDDEVDFVKMDIEGAERILQVLV